MSSYFSKLPNFEYVSRLPNAGISDYSLVKNLFKRGVIRSDILDNLTFFEKYKIIGDDRPDNVAFKVYEDSSLDWIILLSNNITNIQTEWPLPQDVFDSHLRQKYGFDAGLSSEEDIYNNIYNGVHHYETIEIKNSQGVVIIPAGLEVPFNYALGMQYYEETTDTIETIYEAVRVVTNYEYEEKIENEKRNIFVLKPEYISVVINDMEDMMEYKKGATQYVSDTLKRADNIRLYQ